VTLAARLLSLDTPIAVAHRGGSRLRPENTLAAFDHGAALGADAFECDVHLSKDDEVVVIHDPTLDRTTDATGPVAARSARELAEVDAGFNFRGAEGHPYRGRGIGVPTLRELLTRHPSMPVIVEIKGDDPRTARRTVEVIREVGAVERVVIGGFSRVVLDVVRREAPEIPTGASGPEVRSAVRRATFGLAPRPSPFEVFHAPFIWFGKQRFGRRFVRAARRAGRPVQAWIVDREDHMRTLLDWGVTGLISDRPDVAVEVVRRRRGTGVAGPR
jgi:glycerophosphoryl diester phosphodiesterase